MKTSLLSLIGAVVLFASTAASAAPSNDHDRDLRRMSPIERARYEKFQRENERRQAAERARLEAQRRAEQRQAAERARWEAQHHNDRGGYRR
jgi:sensor histidine kinase YesM